MNRLEQLRTVIDSILDTCPDAEEKRCAYVHLYGVSATCTLLAYKRSLDVELCSAAGMLHDIWNYKMGECPEHGRLGAAEAEKILHEMGSFTAQEIMAICDSIVHHSDKQSIDNEMAELLKDADIFQHYLYNPSLFIESARSEISQNSPDKSIRIQRLERVLAELGT